MVEKKTKLQAETELKKVKEAPQQNEILLSEIVNAAMDAVITTDENQRIVIFNTAAESIFGCKAADVLGQTLDRFIPKEIVKLHHQHIQDFSKSEPANRKINRLESFRAVDFNGNEFPVDASISKINFQGKNFFTIILRDISESKKAQEALRKSESFLQGILQSTADGILAMDMNNTALFANEQFFKMWKFPPGSVVQAEVLKFALSQLTAPDEFRQRIRDLYNSQKEYFDTLYFKDGRVFEWFSKPLMSENIHEGRVWSFRDITEYKISEKALRQSESKYRNLYDSMTDGVVSVNMQGYILEANKSYQEMIGYSQQELVRLTYSDLTPKKWHEFEKNIITDRVLSDGYSRIYEKEYIKKDGTIFPIEIHTFLIKNEAGENTGMWAIVRDITERTKTENALTTSEAHYRSLFEDSPIALWEEDFSAVKQQLDRLREEGVTDFREYFAQSPQAVLELASMVKVLDVNKATLMMFKADSKKDLRKNFAELIKDEPIKQFSDELSNIAEGKTKFGLEGVIKTLNGNLKNIVLTWLAVGNTETALSRVLVSMMDITERKQAEELLRNSEQRYRGLFENMPIAIWEEDFSRVKIRLDSLKQQGVTDLRSYFKSHPEILLECFDMIKVLNTNQSALKMYHTDNKEFLLNSLNQKITEREVENFISDLLAIAEGRTSNSWEGIDETLSRELIEISLNWSVAPGHESDFSKVIVTTVDITARKQAEESLRASEEKYRLIIENAGEAIYVVKNGRVVFANHMCEKITGQPLSDLIGKSTIDFIAAQKDRMSILKKHLRLVQGKATNAQYEVEVQLQPGEKRWIDINEVGTMWEGVLATLTFATDITERKRHEREQEALASITQALNQELDLSALLQKLLEAALYAIPLAEKGSILLLDSENILRIQALSGYQDPRVRTSTFSSSTGYAARSIRERRALNIIDTHIDSPIRDIYEIEEMAAIQSAIVAPLLIDGEAIGAIALDNASRKEAFSESELTTLSNFASSAALVIQNTRLLEESRQRVTELELLYESGLAISQFLNPKEIAQKIINLLEQKMHWHHTAIRLYNEDDQTLDLLAFHQPDIKSTEERQTVEARFKAMVSHANQGLSGWVVQHGKAVRTGDLLHDDRYVETFAGLHSGLYVPIKTNKRIIGVIAIESEKTNAFSNSDEQLTSTLAAQAATMFENARLYEEITRHADDLEQHVKERTALIESTKHRFELAAHAGQIGVWEYTPRENKVIWDERMHIIHHIPYGEFDGTYQSWAQLIHPDDIEKSQLNVQLAVTKNLLLNNEHRILWPDNTVRYIATSSVTVFTKDGIPDRIIGINMDVTDRKNIEQSLRESENYSRLLFDAVPDPISVTDINGNIEDINLAFEQQYHVLRNKIHGKNISELGIYSPEELNKRNKYISEVMRNQQPSSIQLNFNALEDGIHTLELHSYPAEVKGRQLILSASRDITAYKKAEDTLQLANLEMQHALRIKDEFLANMSHELRTPLNAILGISESLEEQISGTLNEKQLKYVHIISESGRHLLELINDILDLSKIEAGKLELNVQSFSVQSLCDSCFRLVKELAQKKTLNMSFEIDENVKTILGDERRLKQSIVNLLSNAVKFTPEGKELGLQVSGNRETNEVTFTVWDQGIGIEKNDIKRLFKPFVQLDAGLAREYPGTGLGLAIVSQMVRLHGGHISLESELGKGSQFIITLPWLIPGPTQQAENGNQLEAHSLEFSEKHNIKILLVEDTDVVVALTSDYLRYKGYEVFVARNGMEGVIAAKEKRPDIILMDIMMPVMDGVEATRRIREDTTLQNTIIIALTALAMPGDREQCLAAGMNDYMSKPIQMQELAKTIDNLLIARQGKPNG